MLPVPENGLIISVFLPACATASARYGGNVICELPLLLALLRPCCWNEDRIRKCVEKQEIDCVECSSRHCSNLATSVATSQRRRFELLICAQYIHAALRAIQVCGTGVLSEAGKAMKVDDPCDSLPPDTSCYHDVKVWQPAVASVSSCLLKRPLVYVQENTRLQCDQMRRIDPSVVQVDQSHCYPDEYFSAVPAAAYLLERYPVNLRPKSTDLDVLQQVRPTSQLCPMISHCARTALAR